MACYPVGTGMQMTQHEGEWLPTGVRVAVGLLLGLFLGVVGLPRLDLPLPELPFTTSRPAPIVVAPQETTQLEVIPNLVPPTRARTPTAVPLPTATSGIPHVLLAQRFPAPLPKWPHDPEGNSWFENGTYHLLSRQAGRFVAVGVPLAEPVTNVVVTAQFHKISGPNGGGYGFIIRNQGELSERDSRSQAGRFIVVEVGDQGDIGIWQRDQTRWIDLLPWTPAKAVHKGEEPNMLTLTTRGANLHFEVNGDPVADFTYTGLPTTGSVGIFVGGDLNEVALEWLRIETL
jgi:hypothetical protein